jgi:sodium/hydrogen exchanger 10/11
MKYLIDPSWLLVTGLHIGILCLPTFVTHVIHRLRQLTTRTIHTINLLEGEALLNIGCVLIAHTIILGYRSDLIVHWYQYMAVTARIISFGKCYSREVHFAHESCSGIVIGYVHGFILRFLIRKTSTKPQTIVILMTAFPFLAFLNASLAGSSGTLSVVTFGILMAIERSTLSKQTEDLLNYMWRSLAAIVDVVVCLHVITTIITTEVLPTIHLKDYLLVFVAYIIYYIVRFISFMLFSPVLSRIGAGITFKNMVLVVWGGTKNPIGFMLVDRADYLFDVQYRKFIFYLAGIYFFSHLINGGLIATVLNVLGFTDISLARQVNMNNCMKHIFKKRAQTVAILKMDR